jgi:hypothetical protein
MFDQHERVPRWSTKRKQGRAPSNKKAIALQMQREVPVRCGCTVTGLDNSMQESSVGEKRGTALSRNIQLG